MIAMNKRKRRLEQDGVIILFSIAISFFLLKDGLVESFIASFDGFQFLAIFVAGLFFTSVFTTAPAIAVLSVIAQNNNIFLVALIGGLGAMLGDYIIFRFVKDRISDDFKYVFGFSKKKRVPHIFKTKLFHWFAPFFGALIIASPFPDEIGIAILGLSHTNNKIFLTISYIFNSLGILVIGILARTIV